MQKTRLGLVLSSTFVALCSGFTLTHAADPNAKNAVREVEREFDPDAGTESPLEEGGFEGDVAGSADDCASIGGFSQTFTLPARYRGNLYRILDSGVFLKKIEMQLAFTGTVNLFVSVHRQLPNGTYEEVDIDPSPTQGYRIMTYQGSGANSPQFYSSDDLNGQVGIELIPGDYAIGYAWGPESVKFGRDAGLAYPRPMEVGSTLASVSDELVLPGEPPLPATLPSLLQFTGGTYAQHLCFIPAPGACCLSDGPNSRCENLLEEDCVGEGTYFHGQRTSCKDTICDFGACCFKCGSADEQFNPKCGANYVQDSCTAAGGIQFWPGISCPQDESLLCPKVVGSCCHGGTCSFDECEAECIAPPNVGVYHGDETDCSPDICRGACCRSSGCSSSTQSSCETFGGTFKGYGTSCTTLPLELECGGACCFGYNSTLDQCTGVEYRGQCTYDYDAGGDPPLIAYRGDNTSCAQPCGLLNNYNACCLPDGKCMNTTQPVCTSLTVQGTFQANFRCENISRTTCENMVAVCCYGDGTCDQRTGNSCATRGGSPVPGQSNCSPSACTSFAGACCGVGPGECTMKTAVQCASDGGFYQGDDSDCSVPATTCPGYGACCRGSGECLNSRTQAQCANVGGFFQGAGTTCSDPDVDCETRGACCAVTGTCLQATAGKCAEIDGEFKGVRVGCTPDMCVSGACCLPDQCKPRTPLACASEGGDYRGDDVACGPQACVIRGGCCRQGSCTVEPPTECAVNAGAYLGNDTACIEGACLQGACCRVTGCEDSAQLGSCVGQGEAFHLGMVCSNVSCTAQGACCNGQSCTITTQSGCSGVYQGNGVECAFDTCLATGACCNGTTCTVGTQSTCSSGGGIYQGDNVTCDVNPCVPITGACCNGTTCNVMTQADCTSGGGQYKGDGAPCIAGTTCPASGACCTAQACSVSTQALCSGIYQGDGTDCDPDPCQSSACTGMTASAPVDCTVDARRPHASGNPGAAQGFDSLDMTFSNPCTSVPESFTVTCSPTAAPCPTIIGVSSVGATQTIFLSSVIPAANWTCVKHTASNAEVCMGSLPGDVDGTRTSNPLDILKLIDNLNGIVAPPLTSDHCDLDRSTSCAAVDIITLIDLLNGNGFIVWNGKNLPACPSAP